MFDMEPALYMVNGIEHGADAVTYALHTITPRGKDVRFRLVIRRTTEMTMTKEGRSWAMGGIVFERTGAESDGFVSNLAQLAHTKIPPKARMRDTLVFAYAVGQGDFANLGKGEAYVDLVLWFKMPFGFKSVLRLSEHEVWMLIEDDVNAAAIEAFTTE
jgi:hypothetical protein